MRILHVVTLVSGVGAFGGPTRVAVNQCEALRARGHDTLLVAATLDLPLDTETMGSAPIRLFPARQVSQSRPMSYLWSPAMIRWLRGNVNHFDVVHVHLARDGVTLPAAGIARRRHKPYVVQTHGMISPRAGLAQRTVDRLATVRTLRDADAVFALSAFEVTQLTDVLQADRRIDLLHNGIKTASERREVSAEVPEFLFLARLHPRKRALAFVAAAIRVLGTGARATFTLIGPDEGDGPAVSSAIDAFAAGHESHADALRWLGAIAPDATAARIAQAYAYVLPSVDEPFPMSLIEALAQGRPVIATRTNGLADVIEEYQCGIIVPDDSTDALVDAIERLATDPDLAASMGVRAADAARDRFSIDAVAELLESRYAACLGPSPGDAALRGRDERT